FYAFSVIAALPGLLLLAGCKRTLEYTQATESFMPRTEFRNGYRWALRTLSAGCVVLAGWLLLLAIDAFGWVISGSLLTSLFELGMALALSGIVIGSLLDYLALRKAPQ
ncbi:muropeptide transporter, partial [Winslowiella iniecta]